LTYDYGDLSFARAWEWGINLVFKDARVKTCTYYIALEQTFVSERFVNP